VPHILRRVRSRKSGEDVDSEGRGERAGREELVEKGAMRRGVLDDADPCWQKRHTDCCGVTFEELRRPTARAIVDMRRILLW